MMKKKVNLLFIFLIILFATCFISAAGNFSVSNKSSASQNYFLVNGNNGFVGINTSAPQNSLNVIGDINATGWIYSNGVNLSALNSTGLIINWSSSNGAQYQFGSNNFNGSGYFNTSEPSTALLSIPMDII